MMALLYWAVSAALLIAAAVATRTLRGALWRTALVLAAIGAVLAVPATCQSMPAVVCEGANCRVDTGARCTSLARLPIPYASLVGASKSRFIGAAIVVVAVGAGIGLGRQARPRSSAATR